MIEKITQNIVRCDACNRCLEKGDGYRHVFHSDICDECLGIILQKIESNRLLSTTDFKDLIDEIKYKF